MSIRVGIVDDHPLVTDGLFAALRSIGGFDVVAHGATVDEARQISAFVTGRLRRS